MIFKERFSYLKKMSREVFPFAFAGHSLIIAPSFMKNKSNGAIIKDDVINFTNVLKIKVVTTN